MRFQQSNRTPYLNRGDQKRLLVLVGMIAMIVFSIEFAARPSSWYWLTGRPADAEPDDKKREVPPASTEKVDFRPDMKETSLGPQVIRVVGDHTPADADRYKPTSGASQPADTKEHELKLAPELTALIKDNAVGIRESERELYYYLLAKTRDVPPNDLAEVARPSIAFAVLMNESKDLLGEIITVKGQLRRLTALPAGKNEFGIETLWEGWLFNADSGLNPYCIRMTSLPEGIPTGQELGSGIVVKVTGYFLKRYGYPAQQDRLHVAPLILAKSVRWYEKRPSSVPDDMGIVPYVLGFSGFIAVTISILLFRFRSSDREFEKKHLRRLTAAPAGAIAAIDDLPTFELEDSLRQLSVEHASSIEIDEAGSDEDDRPDEQDAVEQDTVER